MAEQKLFTDIEWGRAQPRVRDYFSLLARLDDASIPEGFRKEQYGVITYDDRSYPLVRVVSQNWNADLPSALITGGVHGCEPAGVEAAMTVIQEVLPDLSRQFNFVVYPCVNPSSYEMDSRWNFLKQDPNRNFMPDTAVEECSLFIKAQQQIGRVDIVLDLHESLQRDSEIMRIQAQDLGNARAATWDDIPTGYFIYEEAPADGKGGWHRIGPQIVSAVSAVLPICNWPTIAGDRNDGGVIYYPQAMNMATTDYTAPVALPDYLKFIGLAGHAFTSETPDVSETGQQFSVAERARGHVTAVRAALNGVLDPKYPKSKP
jgi:hypothetical protein